MDSNKRHFLLKSIMDQAKIPRRGALVVALHLMCPLMCWLLSCGLCGFAVLLDRWQAILGEFLGRCTQCPRSAHRCNSPCSSSAELRQSTAIPNPWSTLSFWLSSMTAFGTDGYWPTASC